MCGDDGVGWHVVQSLEQSLPECSVVAIHQLTPEWAELISQVELVVFVDAAVSGNPGEIGCLRLEPKTSQNGSHELSAEGVLSMAADLYGRCPTAYIVTVVGGSFEISQSLTNPVAESVPLAARLVLELIEKNKTPERS